MVVLLLSTKCAVTQYYRGTALLTRELLHGEFLGTESEKNAFRDFDGGMFICLCVCVCGGCVPLVPTGVQFRANPETAAAAAESIMYRQPPLMMRKVVACAFYADVVEGISVRCTVYEKEL